MKNKALSRLKITDESEGRVAAVFSTLGVIDKDGDVTLPGAFEDGAAVRISAYNHSSWNGALPVGRGVIRADAKEAILDGQFFLDTTAGRETFEVVKQMGDLQEWSYGFDPVEQESGTWDGQAVNLLRKVEVYEVSPVILGAGMGTRTLAVKGIGDDLDDLAVLVERLKEGRELSTANVNRLAAIAGRLREAGDEIEDLVGRNQREEEEGKGRRRGKQVVGDLHERLADAAADRFGGEGVFVWVRDFDLDEGWAVISVASEEGADRRLLRIGFSRDEEGAVTLAGEEIEVVAHTDYSPKGAPAPAKTSLPDQLEVALRELDSLAGRLSDAVTAEDYEGKSPIAADAVTRLKLTVERIGEMVPDSDRDLMREAARFEQARRINA